MLNKKFFLLIFTFCFALTFGKAKKPEIIVEKKYDNLIHENIKIDIKYGGEDLPKLLDYVFIKTLYARVRTDLFQIHQRFITLHLIQNIFY